MNKYASFLALVSVSSAAFTVSFCAKSFALTAPSFAVTSNTLTNADGLYMSLLIGLPLTEWLYKVFSKNHPQKGVESLDEASDIVVEKEDM